ITSAPSSSKAWNASTTRLKSLRRLNRAATGTTPTTVRSSIGKAFVRVLKGVLTMDRKQILVQRAREFFGDRLDAVLHMVQQDRRALHGWEEPPHLRAVLRRAICEGAPAGTGAAPTTVAEYECDRGAGEPQAGQQREAVGQLLEAGGSALEKLSQNQAPDLTAAELWGLGSGLLLD